MGYLILPPGHGFLLGSLEGRKVIRIRAAKLLNQKEGAGQDTSPDHVLFYVCITGKHK